MTERQNPDGSIGPVARLLIVDDDESLVLLLKETLLTDTEVYQIETASSGEEAVIKIAQQPFDLIIADLKMPGIDGLEVIRAARAMSPSTRVILMTAHGSNQVEAEALRLQVYEYVTKPFLAEEMRQMVKQALGNVAISQKGLLVLSDERFETITRCLSDLRSDVGAQCIILADIMGQPISQVGVTEGLDVISLISLIGGGFATTFEMTRHLRDKGPAFNLHYHEGSSYDIYSANVGDHLFLTSFFEKKGRPTRVGMIWLYTRRAIGQLLEITAEAEMVEAGSILEAGFAEALDKKLDYFLDDGILR
jgi:CheY-like chemotaxis protein